MLASACRTTPRPEFKPEDYPGVLRQPEVLGRDLLLRQRVTALWGEDDQRGFDAVIQKVGDTLTVMGLSETGSMGFAIVLNDGEVALTNQMPMQFPFPPRYILLDVQRAFYPWLSEPGSERSDGEHEAIVDGERIVETWAGGRLLTRSFTRLDEMPPGELTIHYRWDEAEWSVPTFVTLDNGWFGYKLEIDTHEETVLTAPSE